MKLDAVHIEILRHLRDGRKSFSDIAGALSVTENTVRSRVNRLRKSGVLDITGLIEPDALPGHKLVIMGIKLSGMKLVKKAAEFGKLPGVVSVSVVTGRYDLILQVLISGDHGLLDFFTEQLDPISGIQSVETFVSYKNIRVRVPYILDPEEEK